jgi:hypothetical protein
VAIPSGVAPWKNCTEETTPVNPSAVKSEAVAVRVTFVPEATDAGCVTVTDGGGLPVP